MFKGNMKWEKIQTKGDIPPGVAAHSAVVLGSNLYMFGGMTADGAISSMYKFNTGKEHTPNFHVYSHCHPVGFSNMFYSACR